MKKAYRKLLATLVIVTLCFVVSVSAFAVAGSRIPSSVKGVSYNGTLSSVEVIPDYRIPMSVTVTSDCRIPLSVNATPVTQEQYIADIASEKGVSLQEAYHIFAETASFESLPSHPTETEKYAIVTQTYKVSRDITVQVDSYVSYLYDTMEHRAIAITGNGKPHCTMKEPDGTWETSITDLVKSTDEMFSYQIVGVGKFQNDAEFSLNPYDGFKITLGNQRHDTYTSDPFMVTFNVGISDLR